MQTELLFSGVTKISGTLSQHMGRQKNNMKREAGFDFRGSAVSSWMEAIDLSEEGVSEITRDFGLEGRKIKI